MEQLEVYLVLVIPTHIVAYYSTMHYVFILDMNCMKTRLYTMNY